MPFDELNRLEDMMSIYFDESGHIRSKEEGWELKADINTCEIWEVINKGKRTSDNPDEFRDVVEDLKKWFKLQTTVPGQTGNNQETAYNKWIALNEE